MRKIILGSLLLVSTLLVAAEKEIWACQGDAGTGFYWDDGQWLLNCIQI